MNETGRMTSICLSWEISPTKLALLIKSRQRMFRQVMAGVFPKKLDAFCEYFSRNCEQCQKDFFGGCLCCNRDMIPERAHSTAGKMGWTFLEKPFSAWNREIMPNFKNKLPTEYGKGAIHYFKVLLRELENEKLGIVNEIYKSHMAAYNAPKESNFDFKNQSFV